MITRRQFLQAGTGSGALLVGSSGYAVAETWRLVTTRYRLSPPGWTPGLSLRVVALADFHFCHPWMTPDHARHAVAAANALAPDVIVLLGDYEPSVDMVRLSRLVPHQDWARTLAGLTAPLGVHAILGNHDWWIDDDAQARRGGITRAGRALEAVGISVYHNRAMRLEKAGRPFWIAGLGDQWALFKPDRPDLRKAKVGAWYDGLNDLPGTLAQVSDDSPVILLAHEPDIFPRVPYRVSLTLSGHTHGGQVVIMGYAPHVASKFGQRFRYGHILEEGRHLIVSGGLGCSRMPVRIGMPPEIVVIDLDGEPPGS